MRSIGLVYYRAFFRKDSAVNQNCLRREQGISHGCREIRHLRSRRCPYHGDRGLTRNALVALQVDGARKKEGALTAQDDAIAPVLAVQFAAT